MSNYKLLTDIRDDVGTADALYFTDITKPIPTAGKALVRVKAFGVNRADIMQRDGDYPVPPNAGRYLGLEFSGVVEQLGEESESSFKVGDDVFGLTYGGKLWNLQHICRSLFLMLSVGAYAGYVVVSLNMLIHKPAHLSWEECAGIPEVRCPQITHRGMPFMLLTTIIQVRPG